MAEAVRAALALLAAERTQRVLAALYDCADGLTAAQLSDATKIGEPDLSPLLRRLASLAMVEGRPIRQPGRPGRPKLRWHATGGEGWELLALAQRLTAPPGG